MALAFMDQRWSATDMTFVEGGTEALYGALELPLRQVSESVEGDLEEMRSGIGLSTAPPPPAPPAGTKDEVDEMRSMLGPHRPAEIQREPH